MDGPSFKGVFMNTGPRSSFSFSVSDEDFEKSGWSNKRYNPFCVEVAKKPEGVAVRDSKDVDKRTLFFTKDEWKAFVLGVKDGQFDVS